MKMGGEKKQSMKILHQEIVMLKEQVKETSWGWAVPSSVHVGLAKPATVSYASLPPIALLASLLSSYASLFSSQLYYLTLQLAS